MIGEVRGWGALQQEFKTEAGAEAFQDEVGKFIADAINEKIKRDFGGKEWKNTNMITCIANIVFILMILFWGWLSYSLIHKDKSSNNFNNQSERQEKNNDYNNNYHP